MDIFTAVIFDGRSIVPDHTRSFSTLAAAKAFVETMNYPEAKWDEWAEGKFIYGLGEDMEEPLAAVYGSVLDEA